MRIAIVNPILAWGGGEQWALATARGLRERGHEVALVTRPGSELGQRARAAGLDTRELPFPSDISPVALLRLARFFRELRPDAVICCNQRAGRLAAPAAKRGGRGRSRAEKMGKASQAGKPAPPSQAGKPAPLVVYRNGLAGSFKNSAYNRWVSRFIDRFVVNAAATREELLSFGWLGAERVSVIYNGIDAAPYRAADGAALRAEWGVPPDGTLAAMVARLVAEKGHAEALPVFARLAEAHPGLRVVIAGEGPERAALAAAAAELGLGERLRLLGPRDDVPQLLAAADLLVHPSRREGAPNIVLEAMAAGKPVVATACDGTPELVLDGETGLLVPVGDAAALEGAVGRLLDDADLRRRLGEAGRRRAETEFSPARALDRWEALLGERAEDLGR